MKKKLCVLLSLIMLIGASIPAYANVSVQDNDSDITRISLDKDVVEQFSLDNNTVAYSNLSTQEEDEQFCKLLDDLLDLKIERYNIENQALNAQYESRLAEIEDAMEDTRKNIEALGGQTLSDEQVQVLIENMQDNSIGTRAKPNVPADTKKYEFTSRDTNAYYNGKIYPVFHIYAQPLTIDKNLLSHKEAADRVDSDKFSSKTKDKVITIYFQKTVSSILQKVSKYASWLPYELLYPTDGIFGNVTYLVEMGGTSYTTMDYIYVSAPNQDVYDLIISTGNAKNSIDIYYYHANEYDKTDVQKTECKGQYYGDSVQAATFYAKGDKTNHYYTLKPATAKIDSKVVFSLQNKTVSSPISL